MGKPIAPTLKFEENEKDDSNDPYICFRRREVRQVRKTRRQDAVSSERIRRLKTEMQQARDLVSMVSSREKMRDEALKAEKKVFLMRCKVKEVKRKLAIVGGDEDLVPLKVLTFTSLAAFESWLTSDYRRRNLFRIYRSPMFAMPYGPMGPLLVRLQ
jgi:enhancer of polycomb-like protein